MVVRYETRNLASRFASLMGMYASLLSDRTWSRPNRKTPGLRPSYIKRSGNIRILIDVSGSIPSQLLRGYLLDIYYGTLRVSAPIYVYPWDVDVYESIKIFSPKDIDKIKVTNKGDKKLMPVLEKADKDVKTRDAVIILSDWNIPDLGESEILLRKIARKIGMMILITTNKDPPKIRGYIIKIGE